MMRIHWKSLTTGATGSGTGSLDNETAKSWVDALNAKFEGLIVHWVENDAPSPAKEPPTPPLTGWYAHMAELENDQEISGGIKHPDAPCPASPTGQSAQNPTVSGADALSQTRGSALIVSRSEPVCNVDPVDVDALEAKLKAALALMDATTGEIARPLAGFPANAWSDAVFAILDDAPKLIAAYRERDKAMEANDDLAAEHFLMLKMTGEYQDKIAALTAERDEAITSAGHAKAAYRGSCDAFALLQSSLAARDEQIAKLTAALELALSVIDEHCPGTHQADEARAALTTRPE